MSLYLALGALTVLALVGAAWPLIRGGRAEDAGGQELAVYRAQLKELDQDVARGLISAAEREAAEVEIQRRMLRAADRAQARPAAPRSPLALYGLAIALPAIGFGLYAVLGSPSVPDQPLAARVAAGDAEMVALADRLAERLRGRPDDARGWMLLGRTQGVLGRWSEAVAAYRRATALVPDDADAWIGLGEALAIAHSGGAIPEEAMTALGKGAVLDPRHPVPRFYRGVFLERDGDARGAYEVWKALLLDAPPEAEWREAMHDRVAALGRRLGLDMAKELPASVASAPARTPGPGAAEIEAAGRMSESDRTAMIRSMVERLAERMASEPENLEGWRRLAQAYRVLGEAAKAEEAERRVRSLEAKSR
ncbi:MAG: c-type cytochrome biogenesis protein CcmI [Alphaproteobacteria bacterium]|nr:c-type cytochrome biogenesis protein CcmI [Alphaproteobacteria bacterium]